MKLLFVIGTAFGVALAMLALPEDHGFAALGAACAAINFCWFLKVTHLMTPPPANPRPVLTEEQVALSSSEPDDQYDPWDAECADLEDCPNCDGEGYVYDCFDGFCVNAEDGCDLCMRRCDWCNPRPPRATVSQAGENNV